MLHQTGSLTIETGQRSARRAHGVLYSQFYSSNKELLAAGNMYPFTNAAAMLPADRSPAIRELPTHRGFCCTRDHITQHWRVSRHESEAW
ncbi:hypothetical protein SBRCBS47491_009352, partial [Sporothrix bragantina]